MSVSVESDLLHRLVDRLNRAQSQQVVHVLAHDLWGWGFRPDQVRAVLVDFWTLCDASGEHRDKMLDLFRLAAPVYDTDIRARPGMRMIYRGNLGEHPRLGLSWTFSREKAEWFAEYALNSPRAGFLRLKRADGAEPVPTVWVAQIPAKKILGYFNVRDEEEVVPDPDHLRGIRLVAPAAGKATQNDAGSA